jgi:Ring finger domain
MTIQEIECAICLEVIDNSTKKTTRCNHIFHIECLSQVHTNKCPLCRQTLEEYFSTPLTEAFRVSSIPTERFLDQIGLTITQEYHDLDRLMPLNYIS